MRFALWKHNNNLLYIPLSCMVLLAVTWRRAVLVGAGHTSVRFTATGVTSVSFWELLSDLVFLAIVLTSFKVKGSLLVKKSFFSTLLLNTCISYISLNFNCVGPSIFFYPVPKIYIVYANCHFVMWYITFLNMLKKKKDLKKCSRVAIRDYTQIRSPRV